MNLKKARGTPCYLGEHVGNAVLPPGGRQVAEKKDHPRNECRDHPDRSRVPQDSDPKDVKQQEMKEPEGGKEIFTGGSFRRRWR